MFSPGSALPQILFAMPCCKTMWSPNRLLRVTSARVVCGVSKISNEKMVKKRMFIAVASSVCLVEDHHGRCVSRCRYSQEYYEPSAEGQKRLPYE